MTFSIKRNMNELTEKGANPKLDPFNGGKVISIAAIMFGHRALYSHGMALYNHEYWEVVSIHTHRIERRRIKIYLIGRIISSILYLNC